MFGRLRDERGAALLIAIGVLAVMTIVLSTVLFLTAAGARSSQRTNAGQKAHALAEAGINNAVAVLNANYPGTTKYPGDPAILTKAGCPCTSTYPTGSVLWTGSLTPAPTGAGWTDEWDITATGTVKNPAGPTEADVKRTVTAVVPIIVPLTVPSGADNPLNFIYGSCDVAFLNSVTVASNVFAGNDLILTKPPNGISGTDDPYAGCGSTVSGKLSGSTAKIAGKGYGNQLDVVAVGRNLYLSGPQIQVGQLSSPAGDPPVDSLWLQNKCSSQATSALHWCVNGGADQMYVTNFYASSSSSTATIPSTLVKVPSLTCCAPYANPLGLGPAAASPPSTMAWLYRNADLGPHAPCQVSSGTPPIFDTASGTPDDSINMSATPAGGPPINLTPGSSYTCRSLRNGSTRGELSWNATSHVLTVTGTVFIDGSAKIDPGPSVKATSAGYGAIVLTGTFQMINATMCVKLSGSSCDQNAWFPDTQALIITTDGDFGTDSTTQGTSTLAGIGIDLQSSDFQGALIANKSVYVETNTGMQGPLVSVYGSVLAGQSGTLTFPPLRFPPSAGGELVNEPPLPKLLPPQQFNGG